MKWRPELLVETQMLIFNFHFGISLGTLIFQNNLSKSLQHDTITAAQGQQLAKLTIDVLKSIRKENKFKSFYDRVLVHQSEFDIDAPTLSRKRRAIRRLQIGLPDGNFHSPPEANYRQIYYEALDLVIEAIYSRFNQLGYKVYRNVEDLVLNACHVCRYDTELSNVCDFYMDDISKMQLQAQLPLLQALFDEAKNKSEFLINDIIMPLSQLSSAQRLGFSNVWILMKTLLVMPATNASSKRSFSGLRRIKAYLRTTMTQEEVKWFNGPEHLQTKKTDLLNLAVVAKEFC